MESGSKNRSSPVRLDRVIIASYVIVSIWKLDTIRLNESVKNGNIGRIGRVLEMTR